MTQLKTHFYEGRNFVNHLLRLNNANKNGDLNDLIKLCIENFCTNHFDALFDICEVNTHVIDICKLPIPSLQEYWIRELKKLGYVSKENIPDPFQKVLELKSKAQLEIEDNNRIDFNP